MKRILNITAGLLTGVLIASHSGHPPSAHPSANGTEAQRQAPVTPVPRLPQAAPAHPAADWSSLESTNYPDYVLNLRSIHVPDSVIADIIRADLTSTCIPQPPSASQITLGQWLSGPPPREELVRRLQESASQLNRVEDIAENQLGLRRVEADGYFLTSEHFRLIKEARGRFPRLATNSSDPSSLEAATRNYHERVAFLSPGMNADQLVAYKVVYEGFGDVIAGVLRSFRPTQAEFYAMVNSMPDGNPTSLRSLLPSILSPARFTAYQSMQEPRMVKLHDAMNSARLSPENRLAALELIDNRERMSTQDFRSRLRQLIPDVLAFDSVLSLSAH